MAGEHLAEVEVRSRADLRGWLEKHHATGDSVWLVTWKKGSPHHLPRDQYVEELICWGWIDSVPRKIDGERTAILVARRNPTSAWSGISKRHAETARRSGAMTEAGEAAIAAAQGNGMWTFLDDVERLEVPADLSAALGGLRARWDEVPPSLRRGTLEWIKQARTDATRTKRIAQVAERLAAGQRPPPSKP